MDSGADLSVLLSTLGALPRLMEVGLSFCEAIESDNALLWSFALDMTVAEESYEYYIRVVSNAIQSARSSSITIYTISLSEFDLPYYFT